MSPVKRIAISVAVAGVIYAALMAGWLAVGDWYGRAFRSAGEIVFGSLGDISVRLEARDDATALDATMVLRSAARPAVASVPLSSRFLGYWPTVLTAALLAATPLRWLRRAKALLFGIALVHLYVAFRVLLIVLSAASADSFAAISFGSFGNDVIEWLADFFARSLTGCWLIPIFIWIAVGWRAKDLRDFIDSDKRRSARVFP